MAWNNGNQGGYGQQGGGGYGNGGGQGGQRSQRVSFAKGSASFNKNSKGPRDRHFGGTLQINGDKRWTSVWLNGPKDNPNAQGAVQHIMQIIAQEGLYLSIDVGDIAPAQQGQGGNNNGGGYQQNNGGYQNGGGGNYGNPGGGYQQQPHQGQQNAPQNGGFQFGGGQGGPAQSQGGFQR
ncbi:MAG TPA: hypothetical protein PKE16_14270 [Hyphomicrobium sp.]|nr:hypothetical protein [Hyphomicrobium sp.]